MTTTEITSAPERVPDEAPVSLLRRLWRRLPDPVTGIVVLVIATFALLSIGSPLYGGATFAGVDTLGHLSPQRDESMPGVTVQSINMGDTVDFALPNATLFGDELRRGEYAQWNPYILGGVPLGATPNFGLLSPVALPFWFLPGWLAPGYMKLLELIVAVGGCYLYLRRVRVRAAAAWLGGLVFASSGYLIVWSNWPQSRVAVFIPALFWALERLLARRRAADLGLVALPVAAMLLSGFPSVTGYAVLTAGGYLLARVLASHWGSWRRVMGVLAAAAGGVLAGVALVAFQLLPWAYFMSRTVIRGREQGPEHHIPPEMLLTSIAPYLFGSVNPDDPPLWFHARIFIEYSFYVGAAAVLLVGVALAAARRARTLLPRGLWFTVVAAAGAWAVLIFYGGLPLAVMQQLPVLFSQNFVGRGRAVLGFLLAVLAAVGFQLLLDGRSRSVAARSRSWWYGISVWLLAGVAGLALLRVAWRIARQQDAVRGGDLPRHVLTELGIGLAFLAAAGLCAAGLWWLRTRWVRGAAAGLIPVLIGIQALMLAVPYHPRVEREQFYPMTEAAAYLKRNLGHDRYFGATGAIYGGIEAPHRIRALHGHIYLDRRLAELIETMPGEQFDTPPTYLNGHSMGGEVARHPVLDRLAVSHYMVSPEETPYGTPYPATTDDSTATLRSGEPVTTTLVTEQPLRAVGITPTAGLPASALQAPRTRLAVTLRDQAGRVVAEADRIVRGLSIGKPYWLPLAAEDVPPGTPLDVEITLRGPSALAVAAVDGSPVLSTVLNPGDGLKLVYDDSSVIYQRENALPRARWASDVVVSRNPAARLRMLANGEVAADQVVLDAPGPAASGKPATVRWVRDGMDEMILSVDAAGAGYLVLADAIQGWTATVDGEPARLVAADHGVAAVHVPAGAHTVRLAYTAPYANTGAWLSALTALLLLTLLVLEWRRRTR